MIVNMSFFETFKKNSDAQIIGDLRELIMEYIGYYISEQAKESIIIYNLYKYKHKQVAKEAS